MLYILAIEQASEGYTQLTLIRENTDQQIAKICDSRPKRYKYIKVITAQYLFKLCGIVL